MKSPQGYGQNSTGRVYYTAAGYAKSNGDKYVHHQKAEAALGRQLKSGEVVHHIDGNPGNNVNTNLVICPNQKYHLLLHSRQRILDKGGHPETDKYCSYHKQLHPRVEFSFSHTQYDGLHNNCRRATNEYRKAKGLNTGPFTWRHRLNQQYRRALGKVELSWLREDTVCSR